MKQLQKIIKLSFQFLNKFLYDYIKSMLKYILIGGFGLIFIPLTMIEPMFAILAFFITIPAFCYSFWRGYVTTYALNYASFDFMNNNPMQNFEEYVKSAKSKEGELVGFVSFMAVISIIGYIPACIHFVNNLSFESLLINPTKIQIDHGTTIAFIITSVVLAQFINFSLQAFFFKKNENYFALMTKCYTNTGIAGFIASNIIIGFVTFLSYKTMIVYALLFLPLNLIIYSFNLFLYFEGIKKRIS